ncbi:SulP family inorganic anion transporter [Solimicrobium silvestre]|uniref:Sulfate permease and related transporters (MFS superfamily) n=1 Tax=Solimicrobium silvestre TaxID=2099400 RepID=A0A2S9GYR5_9BURK|nr:SulP family inorganic anion transporter [Solimicrobium silvestre]PRC92853.1 Sulfate permease and related transporters (MFS superfamily) [Solimicrobium silvestre]
MSRINLHFRPRLWDELLSYNRNRFTQDLIAGLTVGIVALPLAMAFGIASGVAPEAGIFTAIIAGFLISALGGSRVQIGGPAGAFIIVVYGIIEKYGLANLLIATIFSGIIMMAMGVFKLGSLIRFIPVSIVIGFTNGIAVLIALSQMKDFFGLNIAKMPGDFFAQITVMAEQAHTVNWTALGLASASLLVIFGWPLFLTFIGQHAQHQKHLLAPLKKIPSTVIALVLGTLAVYLFGLNVATIGSKFGGIPQQLPGFSLPTFSWVLVKQLFAPSLTIALLGSIESLLCARVADNLMADDLDHHKHDPNQELMALGVANIVVPFFGGIPSTGTIARTVTNVRSGASSPIAGIVHALTLLLIVLAAAPLAASIPLATLAAILLFVAFNMGEWHEFRKLGHFSMNYRIILLGTFLLTVILDLSVAVEVGLMLACIFFIYRISSVTTVTAIDSQQLPEHVAAFSIFGSLFFGAVDKLEALLKPHQIPPEIVILELHQLINMDTTGLDGLQTLQHTLEKYQSQLLLCGTNSQPLDLMRRGGFIDKIGAENCLFDLNHAIQRAHVLCGTSASKNTQNQRTD